jgi:hypothetical protein
MARGFCIGCLKSSGPIHKFFVVIMTATVATMPHNDVGKKNEQTSDSRPAKQRAASTDFHTLMGEVLAHDGG